MSVHKVGRKIKYRPYPGDPHAYTGFGVDGRTWQVRRFREVDGKR